MRRGAPAFGRITWIVDELIGIRELEQRLSEELSGPDHRSAFFMLQQIQELNTRVDVLEKALNDYVLPVPKSPREKASHPAEKVN